MKQCYKSNTSVFSFPCNLALRAELCSEAPYADGMFSTVHKIASWGVLQYKRGLRRQACGASRRFPPDTHFAYDASERRIGNAKL